MRSASFASIVIVAALVVGCGSKSDPNSLPAPAVLVTVDGEPMKNLFLQFIGADGSPLASGSTDAAGKAPVRMGDGQPLPPREYKVVIVDGGEDDGVPKTGNRPKLPVAYGKAATTKGSLTIENGKLEYKLELKTK